MCSWCYAFKPVLASLRQQLPDDMEFVALLGGLAPDTNDPMPEAMRQQLQDTWRRIEIKVPGIEFNHDFWDKWQQTQPRRATYPACRAVIAAHSFDFLEMDSPDSHQFENLMIAAIQKAYYQQALNPSDKQILITLAETIGLDRSAFKKVLEAEACQLELDKQIAQSQQMNARSYPSLVLGITQNDSKNSSFWPVSIDYRNAESMLETINMLLEFED
nr:DsbA family protein [sulfur-oxidizing endosymbiont of Gigantopelta aegis]